LLAATYSTGITLWKRNTGDTLRKIESPLPLTYSVAFSPDAKLIVASSDSQVMLWEVNTGALVITMEHPSGVRAVPFSPDGQLLACRLEDVVGIRKAAWGKVAFTLEDHSDIITDMCFSPDGCIIATASKDKTIRLWNTNTVATVSILGGHKKEIYSVAFSPDGQLLAFTSDKVRLFWPDMEGPKPFTMPEM
jgi:WD40 repeat protein